MDAQLVLGQATNRFDSVEVLLTSSNRDTSISLSETIRLRDVLVDDNYSNEQIIELIDDQQENHKKTRKAQRTVSSQGQIVQLKDWRGQISNANLPEFVVRSFKSIDVFHWFQCPNTLQSREFGSNDFSSASLHSSQLLIQVSSNFYVDSSRSEDERRARGPFAKQRFPSERTSTDQSSHWSSRSQSVGLISRNQFVRIDRSTCLTELFTVDSSRSAATHSDQWDERWSR